MTDISLKTLSQNMKISIQTLIKKLFDIGIIKNKNDFINISEKNFLLKSFKNTNKNNVNTLVVQRKTRSTLNVSTVGGKNKFVQVEVRQKRTYLKNYQLDSDIGTLEKKIIFPKIKKEIPIIVHEKEMNQNNKSLNNNSKIDKNNTINIKTSTTNKVKKINIFHRKDEKNKQLTKYLDIKTKNVMKDKKEGQHIKEEDNKDYLLTTFLHARQAEDDNDHEVEQNKKHTRRVVKNYRLKRNNKKFYNKKPNKEEHLSNKTRKHVKIKQKSLLLQQVFKKPTSILNKDIIISSTISVSELANKMSIKSAEVIKKMMHMGIMGTINQILDQETAQLIAEEMGHKVVLRRENELEELIMKDRDIGNNIYAPRAPIVTIMGHVDHGKTSLLDYIRSTKTALNEAGGITQNIGAYHVKHALGSITFLDTPGHAAFTGMRSRGVKVTDIVVLVVAADDGVMPQTIEAIQHAQEANVPIIIAINKIDKMNSDLNKLQNDLMKYNIHSEQWGGENIFVSVSAKTGKGINKLLNAILLQAEMLELKAISNGMAEGIVIESFLDKGRGPIATVLVKKGCLNKGDIILCGCEYGRVKALRNELGIEVINAGPSIPVEILGLSQVPLSGDLVTVVRNERQAKEVALYRKKKSRELKLSTQNRSNLEHMFKNIQKHHCSELKIILKSDIQGSLEAISNALLKLSNDEVKIKIIGLGIGGITETDTSLALASNAIILGFNVRADASAKKMIDAERLDFRYYSVIYNLIDEVKLAMIGLLKPKYKQKIIGFAEVRNVFKSPKFGFIAGCMVTEGIIKKNNPVHLLRNNVVIHKGELESLRRFKEDVTEIRNGLECGIGIKNYHNISVGDIIEVFDIIKVERTL